MTDVEAGAGVSLECCECDYLPLDYYAIAGSQRGLYSAVKDGQTIMTMSSVDEKKGGKSTGRKTKKSKRSMSKKSTRRRNRKTRDSR
jgi:hypothetical protein